MIAAKIEKIEQPNNSILTIAHMATNNPSYYVEEADNDGRKVSVAYFDENQPDSELEYMDIPTKDLIAFTNEFYRGFTDAEVEGEHVQTKLEQAGIEYLTENLKAVVADYLNQM